MPKQLPMLSRLLTGCPVSGWSASGVQPGPAGGWMTSDESYRRALGATSRVPDQFRPALTVEVCDSPAVGAASPISLGST